MIEKPTAFAGFTLSRSVGHDQKRKNNFTCPVAYGKNKHREGGLYVNMLCNVKKTWLFVSCLSRYIVNRNAQSVGNSISISRISFQAVADMADIDLPGSITHGPGGIGK